MGRRLPFPLRKQRVWTSSRCACSPYRPRACLCARHTVGRLPCCGAMLILCIRWVMLSLLLALSGLLVCEARSAADMPRPYATSVRCTGTWSSQRRRSIQGKAGELAVCKATFAAYFVLDCNGRAAGQRQWQRAGLFGFVAVSPVQGCCLCLRRTRRARPAGCGQREGYPCSRQASPAGRRSRGLVK